MIKVKSLKIADSAKKKLDESDFRAFSGEDQKELKSWINENLSPALSVLLGKSVQATWDEEKSEIMIAPEGFEPLTEEEVSDSTVLLAYHYPVFKQSLKNILKDDSFADEVEEEEYEPDGDPEGDPDEHEPDGDPDEKLDKLDTEKIKNFIENIVIPAIQEKADSFTEEVNVNIEFDPKENVILIDLSNNSEASNNEEVTDSIISVIKDSAPVTLNFKWGTIESPKQKLVKI